MTDSLKVVLNNEINVGADRRKLLYVSGTQKTYNNPANNGSITGGQILFSSVALPSLSNSVLSRNMRIRYRVQVSSTAALPIYDPNGQYNSFAQPISLAPRAFPLSTCTDTVIVTVNNVPTSINLRQTLPAILKTVPKWYLEKQSSEAPSMLDNWPLLPSDAHVEIVAGTPAGGAVSNQVLSAAWNCDHAKSRASFAPVSFSAGGTVAIYEICEPIFCPPFSLYDSQTFLGDVNTISVQFNYSQLNDMFCYGVNLTQAQGTYQPAFTVALVDNSARLEYEVISLDSRVVAVPRVLSYPYAMPQPFDVPITGITAGTATPLSNGAVQNAVAQQSQSLRLSYMPSLIYIYAGLAPSQRASVAVAGQPSYSDCNLAIGQASGAAGALVYNTDQTGVVSIQLNNRQGLLQGASIKDLYRISVKNGYQYSWNEWLMNPIVIVSPVNDLGLDMSQSDIYPDMNGNVTLQVQASFNNWNYIAATTLFAGTASTGWATISVSALRFFVTCVQSGIQEVSPDTLVTNTGPISAAELKEALSKSSAGREDMYLPSTAIDKKTEAGAGLSDLFGSAKNVLSSVAKGVGAVTQDPLFQAVIKKAAQM